MRFFTSLKSNAWKEGFRSIEEMVPGIKRLFDEHGVDTLEMIWQDQVLGALGGNNYEVGDGRIATSQKTGELITAICTHRSRGIYQGRILVVQMTRKITVFGVNQRMQHKYRVLEGARVSTTSQRHGKNRVGGPVFIFPVFWQRKPVLKQISLNQPRVRNFV